MACRTRPYLLLTTQRDSSQTATSVTPVITNSSMRVDGSASGTPSRRLKSVKPLLPPKPVSLRNIKSISANVSACVMIEKYTPLMRERNAKKPNTSASTPGTSSAISAANAKLSKPCQYQG